MTQIPADELRRSLLSADPALSKFDPLPRILCFDDFDRGHCGWSQLIGNYEGDLDTMLAGYQPIASPMLSTIGHWDGGSHGGVDGSYVLKLATRPRRDAVTVGIKRLTFRQPCPIRLEFYMTFKPEASELALLEQDVKSIGFLLDLQGSDTQTNGQRVMPHLRYLNARDGDLQRRWQFKPEAPIIHDIGPGVDTVSHFHLEDTGWRDLPGGNQRLCYNEIPTKVNWHYVSFDFDLRTMQATAFRCNDRQFDMSGFEPMRLPAMKNLWCMLNVCLFAETAVDKRAFLYIDSVCLSGDF